MDVVSPDVAAPARGSDLVAAAPLAFAVLTLFHPAVHPAQMGGTATRWLLVHLVQLALLVPAAHCLVRLVAGSHGRTASLARAATGVFVVCFAAFDAVAGLATGWLARTALDQQGARRKATLSAVRALFDDNWLAGNLSVLGGLAAVAWLVAALSVARLLQRNGAGATTVRLMVLSAVAFSVGHPAPFGTVAMLSLFAVVVRERRRSARTASGHTGMGVPT